MNYTKTEINFLACRVRAIFKALPSYQIDHVPTIKELESQITHNVNSVISTLKEIAVDLISTGSPNFQKVIDVIDLFENPDLLRKTILDVIKEIKQTINDTEKDLREVLEK